MLHMKEINAVPDRHSRYATTKAFFRTKIAQGSSLQSHGVKILSPVEKLEEFKVALDNDTYIGVILQSLPPSYDPFIINYNMNGLEKSIHKIINMLVQYEATTHKSVSAVLVGEASTSKAKSKEGRTLEEEEGCGAHICNNLQVLERSRRLSKDEMILKLGDGKAVAAEAVGSLSLVISDHIKIELKDCYYVPSMIKNIISIPILDDDGYTFMIDKNSFYLMIDNNSHQLGTLVNGLYIFQQSNWIMAAQHKQKLDNHENAQLWHARLSHISKDRIWKLVDSKSPEVDDLDNLPTNESCLKGKMTKKPFVGQSAIANGLLDLIYTDIYGPLNTPARGGYSYFITFTNNHSWYGYFT
ncbi:Retrovirus-related Pol polyprotein from transposon TNT 1-94 [Sesamum angolense]|uniref:Retrovirus-related Pol polyprotein from transposon TNT 1-94 n=1 Tax=Sesamum angolense TaxID=2727404 RepID=A0AAE1WAQ2_9LAMI|nr:Retrovirus-related Pol polyprotein from transposon TNT 1-94 [Sesamum angolense]